jgi:hypothetical protein
MGDKKCMQSFSEGRVEEERSLVTHRWIWYVNIKMYLKETGVL